MTRLRYLSVLAIVLGLLLTACGAGVDVGAPSDPDDPGTSPDPNTEEPGGGDPGTDPDGPDDADKTGPEVSVYFVRSSDAGIYVEPETHQLDEPTQAVAREAMKILFAGTTHDPDLTTSSPDGVDVLATNVVDRVLIVDVSDDILASGAGSAQELAFAQQLAHTGAAFATVDAVQLWVDGEPIDELWGHFDWSQPIEPDPFALSPITITDPAYGETVSVGDVTVGGEATVFEANFGIRLYGPDGSLVAEDFVMADAGAPERGSWTYTFTITTAGTYTVEVEEDDPSDGEGRPPFTMSRQIEVEGS